MQTLCFKELSSKFKLIFLVFLILFIAGCGIRKSRPTAFSPDNAGINSAPGETGVYANAPQKRAVDRPDGSVDSVDIVPLFSCCEENIIVKGRPIKIKCRLNFMGQQSLLKVFFQVKLEFDCQQEDTLCRGTFESIQPTQNPDFIIKEAPNLNNVIAPATTKIWWNEAVEECDGNTYKTKLSVVYLAQYAGKAIPNIGVGNARARIKLQFNIPANKGTSYEGEFEIWTDNLKKPPTIRLISWRSL
ncbi:hypothetical protein ACFLSY_03565 [Bacteroidota bacterium]